MLSNKKKNKKNKFEEEFEIIKGSKLLIKKKRKRKIHICYVYIVTFYSILVVSAIITILIIKDKYQKNYYNISMVKNNNSFNNWPNKTNSDNNLNKKNNNNYSKPNLNNNVNLSNNPKIENREIALKKGLDFINTCKNGLLLNKKNFSEILNPKISIVIPVYNRENQIKRVICSIQNQNMIDIEIILVDDGSNDQTNEVIEKIKNDDKRIKIIKNNKNMGSLYSRSIGVLESKGEYITTIDSDDMFSEENVFNTIYDEAKKTNYDIISFKAFDFHNLYRIVDDYFTNIPGNLSIFQPELGLFHLTNDSIIPNNIVIWGKLIRNEVNKNAVNMLGKEKYTKHIIWNDDTCLFFAISLAAQSFKFIEKYGIIRFFEGGQTTSSYHKEEYIRGELLVTDVILDLSRDTDKNKAAKRIFSLTPAQLLDLSHKELLDYFNSVMTKFLNNKNIEEQYKNELRKKYEKYNLTCFK